MNHSFTQIITDQSEEKSLFRQKGWVHRKSETFIDTNSSLIQIITGVRRSGKSTLAHRALKNKKYGYINFDDERLSNITPASLNDILESVFEVYQNVEYLFLDEVQNVNGWHLFVNRLQRSGMHLIVTGSNSKLLSTELASHLTGRYNIIELFPFSFQEFLNFKKFKYDTLTTKNKGLLRSFFNEYMNSGGFPEVLKGANAIQYVTNLFNSIVTRDILFRFNIKHKQTFKDIALFLVNNFSREISYNRIKKLFDLGSEHTAKNYVSYLEEAYLIITLPKFSFKKQESIKYKKNYIIDTAFASAICSNLSQNSGYLLENIVLLELYRRKQTDNFDLFYYKKNVEVDFVLYKEHRAEALIQVCFDTADEKTRKREIRALIQAAEELKSDRLLILTFDEKQTVVEGGKTIKIIPVYEWLMT
ncbi:MAG TPA: ATP-binding protein [Bacteroidales bacterium]|nr:ATP-binding protein [Bacteroidales bacterium]HQN15542.1 ATP-binding protein [Bacteroidales bacterium]HQP15365.1 ATP-binding protein [Bacteroidales bacterium]